MMILHKRGDVLFLAGQVLDVYNNAKNIYGTGNTIKISIKRSPSDTEVLLTAGATVLDDENGEFTIFIPSTSTLVLTQGKYFYDIELNDSNNFYTIDSGIIQVVYDISR